MDTFPQSTHSISDDADISLPELSEDYMGGAEAHIHMPNPSYWPLLLGVAIAIAMVGLLFISDTPWIFIGALPLVLVCALGWAVEDPFAPMKEEYIPDYQAAAVDPWKYKIDQDVVDSQGNWLGTVKARFSRYILVERGSFIPKVYYVPQSAIREQIKDNTIFLTMSEDDLVRMELNRVPADLYDDLQETEVVSVRGMPQFARRPLSPAETGHYNYGRRSPGINTDASGSYHREEVLPKPQMYVTEELYSTDEVIPDRVTSPD